jgi:Ca2+/H+ antiporter, TMEM165/GDT1 family
MVRRRVSRFIAFFIMAILAAALFALITMGLWNWLVPELFGGKPIGLWQAIGLLVLARILFGGRSFVGGRHGHWRRRMRERWDQMTPEQREVFRAAMRALGCGFEPPAAAPAAAPPPA